MRKTSQFLLPADQPESREGYYDIYPSFAIEGGLVFSGFDALAEIAANEKTLIIDGYIACSES